MLARLEADDIPSAESQAAYFINGLRKILRSSVVNMDIAAGFEQIVLVATRVEKRLGVTSSTKKKSRSSDSDSESDSDSDSESESETDDSDSEEESDSDSTEGKKKKKKSKKRTSLRNKEGKKKQKKTEDDDHQFLKKVEKVGIVSSSVS